MAGAGKRTFIAGEVLTAAQVNDYLMDQAVMRFSGSAARAASITAPTEGMVTYLDDTNNLEKYDGSTWVTIMDVSQLTAKGDLLAASAAGLTARVPVGADGTVLTASSGAPGGMAWGTAGVSGYVYNETVTFNNSASFTKASYPGMAAIRVRLVGGGGSGGNWNAVNGGQAGVAGGGSGAYAESFILAASVANSVTVTIGAGGGGAGGTTSFGNQVIAGGGGAGANTTNGAFALNGVNAGGSAGNANAGDLQRRGEHGFAGYVGPAPGQPGGSSAFGGGGGYTAPGGSGAAGAAGSAPGSGGGGAAGAGNTSQSGGAGAAGVVYIDIFK